MEIREATDSDAAAIRSIAHDSLNSTYTAFLEEETIDEAIDQWYGDSLDDELDDDRSLFLIVERDGEIAGFSQSELVGQQANTGHFALVAHSSRPPRRRDGRSIAGPHSRSVTRGRSGRNSVLRSRGQRGW